MARTDFDRTQFPRWWSVGPRAARAIAPVLALVAATGAEVADASLPARDGTARALAALPLRYEENLGQAGEGVRFTARAASHAVLLTNAGPAAPIAWFAPARGGGPIALRVLGVEAVSRPRASRTLPGQSHYLIGRDPEKWRRGVRGYGRVTYEAIYPGIDLVFHGSGRDVEFDFVVAPGADPNVISLAFEGIERARLEPTGSLVLEPGKGQALRARAPVVYQDVDGERRPVEGRFAASENDAGRVEIGFEIGSYEPSVPLVIDPVMSWSTYLGGTTSADEILDLDVDESGNVYVTGFTTSTDYPTTGGALDTTANGGVDAFVTKLSADGSALVYSTYFGGNVDDNFTHAGIAVDAAGQAHIAGVTNGGSFPTTAGVYQENSNGGSECYVAKLSADGSTLLYSTYLGGNSNDTCRDIALDSSGRAYVTGSAQGNFPTTLGAFDTILGGGIEAFAAAFSSLGGLVYSTYVGGSGFDAGYGIALVGQEAVITGQTFSTDFPLSAAFQGTKGGGFDGFLTRLNATGTAVSVSTYIGGSDRDLGARVATDGAGSMYVTGETESVDFPTTTGAYQENANGGDDAFVVKVSSTGALEFSSYLGGTSTDRGTAIAVRNGAAVVAGETRSTDFPTVDPVQASLAGISSDGFISAFAADGAALDFSTYLGGSGPGGTGSENNRDSSGLEVDAAGSVYVAGPTASDDFPTTTGVFQETDVASGVESYVAKISFAALPVPALGGPGLLGLGLALAAAAQCARAGRTGRRARRMTSQ